VGQSLLIIENSISVLWDDKIRENEMDGDGCFGVIEVALQSLLTRFLISVFDLVTSVLNWIFMDPCIVDDSV
jgi:hypothetical protein